MSVPGTSTPGVVAAVLAGGRSRRLGVDKRLVEVGGRTLLARTVATVAPLVAQVLIIVATGADRVTVDAALDHDAGADGAPDVRVLVDARSGIGPGAGLETALQATDRDVLVLAADHPWLSVDVVELLLAEAAEHPERLAVALEGPFGAEPMLAVYRPDALRIVARLLDQDVRRMRTLLAALDPAVLELARWQELDPGARSLVDVDTPEDLIRLEEPRA